VIRNIKTIILGRMVGNCYLLETDQGFVLIDTGSKSARSKLEKELADAGCTPENFHLVILTHGDFDHSGNCAYLCEKYSVKIAMHQNDVAMVESGDMFRNRKSGNRVMKKIINTFFGITMFTPDFTIDEGHDLSDYGLDIEILHIPGHSGGSIGILTDNHDLFCGDLLTNSKKPEPNSLFDDLEEMNESIDKLKHLQINMVYPGHGQPFLMDEFLKDV
jgi:hydroxyacylglutathione hydrolase